jgi:photosystem II stability/assembly factor-like uncharacterized protein
MDEAMKKSGVVLGVVVGAVMSFAASGAAGPDVFLKSIASGTAHEALMSVAFDHQAGVAVGAAGEIKNTADGGKSWTQDPAPSPLALLGVDIRNGLTIAVGQMGFIVTRDGSGGWQKRDSGTTERLLSVGLNSKGDAVAVGSFGTVIMSTDRGATWHPIAPDWGTLVKDQGDQFMPHIYAVQIDDNDTITIAGELGSILRTQDAGKSWAFLHHGDVASQKEVESLFALDIRSDGVAYAVGQNGLILRSKDGGQTWQNANSNINSNLLAIHSSTDGVIVATGMYSMLVSKDDGQSWDIVSDQAVASSWYSGVARPEGGATYVVGKAGSIMRVTL